MFGAKLSFLLGLLVHRTTAALLDEEASTAPRTFGGGVETRASQPLLHTEEIPEWVRLTFADHYLGATRRSPHLPSEPGEGTSTDTDETLEMLEEWAAGPNDLFDAPLPHDHVQAVQELRDHHHVAHPAHRHGRRRTHTTHSNGVHVHTEHIYELAKGAAARERASTLAKHSGWDGGGVDKMVGLIHKHPDTADGPSGNFPHGKVQGGSAHTDSDAPRTPRRPVPSLQGRPAAQFGHRALAEVPTPGSTASRGPIAPRGFDFMMTSPESQSSNLTAIAEQAANRALRRHGLLDVAPGPIATRSDLSVSAAHSFLELGSKAVVIDARSGSPFRPSPAHWEEQFVDSIIHQLGLQT